MGDYHLNLNDVYPTQALYGFQLAPNGKYLCLVNQRDKHTEDSRSGNDLQKIKTKLLSDLYLLPIDGGFPRQLTNSGDIQQPAIWAPDAKRLVVERNNTLQIITVEGQEIQTIYRGKLYHPPLAQGDAILRSPSWSPDGHHIVFAVHETPKTKLLLVSTDGRLVRELFSIEGYIIGWDWSPDGQEVLMVTRYENGWSGDIRILDIQSGDTKVLYEENNYEYCKPVARWHPGGDCFVFRSNRSGWAKLWIAQSNGKNLRQLTFGNWDDYAFNFSTDGKQIVYASRAAQTGSGDDLWVIPINNGDPIRLTQHSGVNVPLAWSKDESVFYWHTDPTEMGDLYSVQTNRMDPVKLTWSTPLALNRKLSPPEEVIFPNKADNTQVSALIYRPIDFEPEKRYPAIVWIRGGPTDMCRYAFKPFYNWLANQGYIVITPNYRGSIGYGVAHMSAVAGQGLGKVDLSDVLAAGQYVRTLPEVDLSRGVGVGGRSWGGYLTLMAVTQTPETFSCAVAGAAIANWSIQQSQTEVRYYDRWLVGGWIYEQEAHAKDRSPISFVERIQAPLLVYHGEEDRDVPFAQIGPFVKRAQERGKDVEYVTYSAEGHSNKKPENQQDVLNRIENFFRKHLKPWNYRDNPCADQVQ